MKVGNGKLRLFTECEVREMQLFALRCCNKNCSRLLRYDGLEDGIFVVNENYAIVEATLNSFIVLRYLGVTLDGLATVLTEMYREHTVIDRQDVTAFSEALASLAMSEAAPAISAPSSAASAKAVGPQVTVEGRALTPSPKELLAADLARRGFRRVVLAGNGNCLFSSLAFLYNRLIGVVMKTQHDMRQMLHDYLLKPGLAAENPDLLALIQGSIDDKALAVGVDASSLESYAESVMNPRYWGSFVDATLLSSVLRVRLTIFESRPPSCIVDFIQGDYRNLPGCIGNMALLHIGNHFDALVPLGGIVDGATEANAAAYAADEPPLRFVPQAIPVEMPRRPAPIAASPSVAVVAVEHSAGASQFPAVTASLAAQSPQAVAVTQAPQAVAAAQSPPAAVATQSPQAAVATESPQAVAATQAPQAFAAAQLPLAAGVAQSPPAAGVILSPPAAVAAQSPHAVAAVAAAPFLAIPDVFCPQLPPSPLVLVANESSSGAAPLFRPVPSRPVQSWLVSNALSAFADVRAVEDRCMVCPFCRDNPQTLVPDGISAGVAARHGKKFAKDSRPCCQWELATVEPKDFYFLSGITGMREYSKLLYRFVRPPGLYGKPAPQAPANEPPLLLTELTLLIVWLRKLNIASREVSLRMRALADVLEYLRDHVPETAVPGTTRLRCPESWAHLLYPLCMPSAIWVIHNPRDQASLLRALMAPGALDPTKTGDQLRKSVEQLAPWVADYFDASAMTSFPHVSKVFRVRGRKHSGMPICPCRYFMV